MATQTIKTGTVHSVPTVLKDILRSNQPVLAVWNNLTPLARNEWICFVTLVKKAETKESHLTRLQADLLRGKRRPCCWPGCPHRSKIKRT